MWNLRWGPGSLRAWGGERGASTQEVCTGKEHDQVALQKGQPGNDTWKAWEEVEMGAVVRSLGW